MSRVNYSPQAQVDLKEQFEYRGDFSDQAAKRFADRIAEAIYGLAEFPALGRARPELAVGLRSFAVNDLTVTVFYHIVDMEGKAILIIRIMGQEREIDPGDFM